MYGLLNQKKKKKKKKMDVIAANWAIVITSFLAIFILFARIRGIHCELINDPSLKPANPFSADCDAEKIRNEMVKSLTDIDRNEISKIFFHKTYDQRVQIEESYDKKFCQNKNENKCTFHSALKDISTIAMEALYVDALVSPEGILAQTINRYVEAGKGDTGAMEEIVCANDKPMKDRINQYYTSEFGISVEEAVAKFQKDDKDYQNVMIKYCWKGLSQDKKITPQDVDNEAQALRKIDPKADKEGFKKKLMELLDKTSELDLKLIFQKYRQDDHGINEAVCDAFEVEVVRRAYGYLVRYIEDTCKFYADHLHEAVGGTFTFLVRVDKINRVILTRCERDLLCIFHKYKDLHDGKTFTNHLKTLLVDKCVFYELAPQKRYVESIRYLCGKP